MIDKPCYYYNYPPIAQLTAKLIAQHSCQLESWHWLADGTGKEEPCREILHHLAGRYTADSGDIGERGYWPWPMDIWAAERNGSSRQPMDYWVVEGLP